MVYLMCLWFTWKHLFLICKYSLIDAFLLIDNISVTVVSPSIIYLKSTNWSSAPPQPLRSEPLTILSCLDHCICLSGLGC